MAEKKKTMPSGKLRIGDDWNAITIIALSQNNPLKAVAEFVENSIDAGARHVTIVRGREQGEGFISIKDDGEGVRRDEKGVPDFHYVATHICDSIKRRLKANGASGIQGEFGIGLLSFWTLGEDLILTSAGADQRLYHMHMTKGTPTYRISQRRALVAERGTELSVRRILPGIRQLSGEKIQWYLASELRNRIRSSGVQIRIIDRTARAEFKVEPRQFEGRLLHEFEKTAGREIYLELYLSPKPESVVGLYRCGTRVLENIGELPVFQKPPWTSGYLQGIVDAPYLQLTPGTRTGLVFDEAFVRLADELKPVEAALIRILEEQRRAEEEQTSRDVLRSIQKALKEALLVLPDEEYDWFNVRGRMNKPKGEEPLEPVSAEDAIREQGPGDETAESPQKQFFEFPGPLFSVRVVPASSVVPVGGKKNFRAAGRDRKNQPVTENLTFQWRIAEGLGELENAAGEICGFSASPQPGLVRLEVTASQRDVSCLGEARITVTDSLLPEAKARDGMNQGIPSYTFQHAPGQLWRSRYEPGQNVIVINNGHRDFVFASRNRALQLRYLCRLFAKELILKNFPGIPPDQLLERLIELSLYADENLR